jgi:hypothetical protein
MRVHTVSRIQSISQKQKQISKQLNKTQIFCISKRASLASTQWYHVISC